MSNEERWYAVDKIGMATLCKDRADATEEAEQGDASFPHRGPYIATRLLAIDADGGKDIAQDLRDVLGWEANRMGAISAGLIKADIALLESMIGDVS